MALLMGMSALYFSSYQLLLKSDVKIFAAGSWGKFASGVIDSLYVKPSYALSVQPGKGVGFWFKQKP